MARIDNLPSTVLPSEDHVFAAMKDGNTVRLRVGQIREALGLDKSPLYSEGNINDLPLRNGLVTVSGVQGAPTAGAFIIETMINQSGDWGFRYAYEIGGTGISAVYRQERDSGVWGVWSPIIETQAELDARYVNEGDFTTALGFRDAEISNRLRIDAAQTLTAGQKSQGRTNLGLTDLGTKSRISLGDIGDISPGNLIGRYSGVGAPTVLDGNAVRSMLGIGGTVDKAVYAGGVWAAAGGNEYALAPTNQFLLGMDFVPTGPRFACIANVAFDSTNTGKFCYASIALFNMANGIQVTTSAEIAISHKGAGYDGIVTPMLAYDGLGVGVPYRIWLQARINTTGVVYPRGMRVMGWSM